MRCRAARRMMSRYLDGELPETRRSSVDQHLGCCPECRSEFAAQDRLWSLLGRAAPAPSPDVFAAVEARLSERPGLSFAFSRLRPRHVGYAAAAAVLVGLAILSGVWAGTERYSANGGDKDGTFAELTTNAPPGMEIAAILDEIGERP